jgi:serine/threonine protein phosphatase 1
VRVLAIGDIHGCIVSFETLLAAVQPSSDDLIVTLGDYVDRGPRSRDVIEKLIALQATGRLVALTGNHDQMMLDARTGDPAKLWWLDDYGADTLASYVTSGKGSLEDVPEAHWRFLERDCRDWFETETHFFVHANAYPDVPFAEQPVYMLRWESFGEPAPHSSGKTMVCGHTSQKSGRPKHVGHAICIDTYATVAAGSRVSTRRAGGSGRRTRSARSRRAGSTITGRNRRPPGVRTGPATPILSPWPQDA